MSLAGAPALPRLRPDVRLVEQTFGDEHGVVVKDPASGKYYRMRPIEAQVLRALDGTRDAAAVVRLLADRGVSVGEATVEAFARSCARLGLLERSFEERTTLELERLRAERRRKRSLFRGELMRMRWSFGHPDRLVSRTMPWVRWCFTRGFVAASVALFVAYFAVLVLAWPEFTRAMGDLLDVSQLHAARIGIYMAVTLVVIIIHELGHAFTCKHFGGEVRELGFMIIYLQPAFYCNVNDAWSFPELRARLWVTAAGTWIQMVVAGIAALVWWLAAPDTLLAEVALAGMIAGGMSSVLTNANPLLPLDGYFALTDWLAIPNLRQRGLAWAGWWVRRRLLGLDVPEPTASARDARVLRWYGALAAAYITVVLTLLAVLVLRFASRVAGTVGVVLGAAWLYLVLGRALRTWIPAVATGTRLRLARHPAWRRWGVAGLAALVVVGALPWRGRVRGDARATGAHDAAVAAPVPGIVTAVLVREGERVRAGAPLLRVSEPALALRMERLTRDADSLAALERAARATGDAAGSELLDAKRRAAAAELASLAQRAARVLRAPLSGEVVTPHPERLLGRQLGAGEAALRLVDTDSIEVRVALAGTGAASVHPGQEVRLVSLLDPAVRSRARILAVSGSDATDGGRVEVRARLPHADAWRPGVRGEAQVFLDRTTIAGALWRAVRERVRAEAFL